MGPPSQRIVFLVSQALIAQWQLPRLPNVQLEPSIQVSLALPKVTVHYVFLVTTVPLGPLILRIALLERTGQHKMQPSSVTVFRVLGAISVSSERPIQANALLEHTGVNPGLNLRLSAQIVPLEISVPPIRSIR